MLLSHLHTFVVALHVSTVVPEIGEFPAEHLVLTEFTFKRTIIYRHFQRWLQPDSLETLLTIRENPRLVALELMFQPLAYHTVCIQEVWRGYTFAIRGIADDYGLLLWLCEFLEVCTFHINNLCQTGSPDIYLRCIDSLDVYIVAFYLMVEWAFL